MALSQALPILAQLVQGKTLTSIEAKVIMKALMQGKFSEVQTASFLTALAQRNISSGELTAFASVMREMALSVQTPLACMDTCGTGGGSVATFNVSTASAFVLAAAGVLVAKHGNRAITSKAGSSDVLEALGLRVGVTPKQAKKALNKIGICFLFAPAFHPAMKFVQPTRKQLPFRTVFNLLGPLVNPVSPAYQLMGVYDPSLLPLMADTFVKLKVKRAAVVHGLSVKKQESLDELSLLGPTKVIEVIGGRKKIFTLHPQKMGFKIAMAKDLLGGTAKQNARIIEKILKGKDAGPKEDLIVLNAGYGLYISGKVKNMKEGFFLARQLIRQGEPFEKLQSLKTYLNKG